ncbi:MAG: serine hydrolase [Lewinellaceae bacterium]|nr:serine hydrolase [Phaeodactylibacter sp.]MCB0612412.1 serine hydrolase [Phaeodactylibacter sp.]MCB9348261.1 serine hydrolase [Lewinellaceae bacterium]
MLSFLRFALPVCFSLLLFTTCSKEAAEDPINHLPEIDTPMEVLAYADSLFTYTIAVEDIDGDEVTVTAGGLPGWLAFDSGSRKLSGTPSRQNEGAREITITADDGKGQRSRKLTIRVVALLTFQEKLDEELLNHFYLTTTGILGVSAAVATPEGELFTSTAGKHSPFSDGAVNPNHRYRMASVSKIFTAALILRLAEEGHFELDDKLFDYLPIDGLEYGEAITIRQLLSHTSGLVDHLNSSDFFTGSWMTRTWTNEDIFDYAVQKGALFEPGTAYAYSNTGFYILGALAEKVTGLGLSEAFEQWIFAPLGLEQTLYDDFSNRIAHIAGLAENERAYEYHLSSVGAAGAIVSTPGDVAKFGLALYGGQFLSPASLQQMTTDYGFAVGGDHYGLGTRLWDDYGIIHHGHTGALMDYRTILMYVPAKGICIALATNDPHSRWYDLVNGLLVDMVQFY